MAGVVLALAILSVAAMAWCLQRGYTLYYGDAEAHLDIARRILDSRTPGLEQFGTVWLPLPHLLMLPLIRHDSLWRNGLAGAIPSGICFVLGGAFLFAAARRAYDSAPAGVAVALLFALNVNILYLQAIPMTEPLLLASFAALLWATLWFRDSQSIGAILAAAAASNAASLTRYEGWFVVPFVCLYLLVVAKQKWHAVLFGALAAIGPLAWLGFNQYYYSNPLEFYNGPYSALARYRAQLAQGVFYPTDHNWRKSFEYYSAAARLVAGPLLLLAGAAGVIVAAFRRVWWPLVFFAITPLFYIWSMHSSGNPIYVPGLWPFGSYYNIRYAIVILPLAAFAAGALVYRSALVAGIVVIAGCGALLPSSYSSIIWKESQVNSESRRASIAEAAQFLDHEYTAGTGILYSFGDLTGVLREAGIPLREGLHQGNHPLWDTTVARPDLGLHTEWVLALSGDTVSHLMLRAKALGLHYELRKRIVVDGASGSIPSAIEIYQRQP